MRGAVIIDQLRRGEAGIEQMGQENASGTGKSGLPHPRLAQEGLGRTKERGRLASDKGLSGAPRLRQTGRLGQEESSYEEQQG
ncbi:hypothetical protein GCM10012275_08350 [Longimycelium tulufanense]|uniref:Uncharacterized protein n=1 Tax=Longimycelium tulufanense TaxID=907463 RepID=A0A8J3CAM4_9PSEU|nr:hypothetical protein [Longimycelium tulufanense]GGM39799.1 hypothetical protein GCM10012275_08350 [Longimycelium tulufanense]